MVEKVSCNVRSKNGVMLQQIYVPVNNFMVGLLEQIL